MGISGKAKVKSKKAKVKTNKVRKDSDIYKKIVYWSDEDNCFIGRCPELMYGGIHGKDAIKVFKELCVACEEVIEIYQEDGVSLPVPQEIVLQAA